jgi:transposase-like protein
MQAYTPEVHKSIVSCVRGGNKRSTAAKKSGIHPRTLNRWLVDESGTYDQLKADIEQAEAENETVLVSALNQMAYDDSKATQYLLDKRYNWDNLASIVLERVLPILEEIGNEEVTIAFLKAVEEGAFEG